MLYKIDEILLDRILTNLDERKKAQAGYREMIAQLINVVYCFDYKIPTAADSIKETLFEVTGKTWTEIKALKDGMFL
jgi:hypothetical protein